MADFEQDVLTTDVSINDFEASVESATPADNQASGAAESGACVDEDDRKLFVGGLHFESTEDQIREYFEKFGEVEKCELKLNPESGKSRCFAFVLFKTIAGVNKAIAEKSHTLKGRQIDPKLANKREVNTKIFVGGLSKDASDDDIRTYFEKFGKIKEMDLPVDINNKRRGFCFINYETKDGMEKAAAQRMQTVAGKSCEVKKSAPKGQSQGRGGFGDSGGRGRGFNHGYHPYGGDMGGAQYYGGGYGGYEDYYGYGGYGDGGWGGYDQSYGYGGYPGQQSSYGKYPRRGRGGGYGGY